MAGRDQCNEDAGRHRLERSQQHRSLRIPDHKQYVSRARAVLEWEPVLDSLELPAPLTRRRAEGQEGQGQGQGQAVTRAESLAPDSRERLACVEKGGWKWWI